MTLVQAPSPAADRVAGEDGLSSFARAPGGRRREPAGGAALARHIGGSAILILAVSLLGFAAWLTFLSRLHYDRAQHDAYASFRAALALATAPTGPTQPGQPHHVLTLGTPVALLSIPEIGLRAVVLEGTTAQVLEDGPGHLRDAPLPGQPGISEILGRRAAYGGPFSRLASLTPGVTFTVTTGQGVARYRVVDVRRPGDLIPPLTPGQGRLVLATADGPPFAPSGVLRVDANLISPPRQAPQMLISAGDLAPGENPMGVEPLAWVPLVLWGQCLLIAAGGLSFMAARWGGWQTWIVATPVLGYVGLSVADQAARLLPNLM